MWINGPSSRYNIIIQKHCALYRICVIGVCFGFLRIPSGWSMTIKDSHWIDRSRDCLLQNLSMITTKNKISTLLALNAGYLLAIGAPRLPHLPNRHTHNTTHTHTHTHNTHTTPTHIHKKLIEKYVHVMTSAEANSLIIRLTSKAGGMRWKVFVHIVSFQAHAWPCTVHSCHVCRHWTIPSVHYRLTIALTHDIYILLATYQSLFL